MDKHEHYARIDVDGVLSVYEPQSSSLKTFPKTKLKMVSLSGAGSAEVRSPSRVYIDLTYRCNLNCLHCITNSGTNINIQNELKLSEIFELLVELSQCALFEIAIGGGEPLMHPDIFAIIKFGRRLGTGIVLTTNGTLLQEETVKKLAESDLSKLKVSIDGTSEQHDKIRGIGSFQKAIKGLECARKYLSWVGIRTTVVKGTIGNIPQIVRLAENIGCNEVKIALVKPFGRATSYPDFLLSRKDLADLVALIHDLRATTKVKVRFSAEDSRQLLAPFDDKLRTENVYNCGVGTDSCYINPIGLVFPCVTLQNMCAGNLRVASFHAIWRKSPILNTLRKELPKCRSRLCCEEFGKTNLPFIIDNLRDK